MDREHKPITPAFIDDIVNAEFPDRNKNPLLHQIATSQNIHGPCGNIDRNSLCMDRGQWTKNFPKQWQDETKVTESSHTLYMRSPENEGVWIGNFCRQLFYRPIQPNTICAISCTDNCGSCAFGSSCKVPLQIHNRRSRLYFLWKLGQKTKISRYVNTRYISTKEAFWRMYGFEIHSKHSPAEKLPCHLQDQQTILFQPEEIP